MDSVLNRWLPLRSYPWAIPFFSLWPRSIEIWFFFIWYDKISINIFGLRNDLWKVSRSRVSIGTTIVILSPALSTYRTFATLHRNSRVFKAKSQKQWPPIFHIKFRKAPEWFDMSLKHFSGTILDAGKLKPQYVCIQKDYSFFKKSRKFI